MKSIFLLCDYGISYNTALRLYENNVTLIEIVNNPDILISVFGARSKKADEILPCAYKALTSEKKYSIYDLTANGLSKQLTDLLFEHNISMADINEELLQKDFIGDSTFKKIMMSYEEFMVNNNVKKSLDNDKLVDLIKKNFYYGYFTLDDLKKILIENNFECENLDVVLSKLVAQTKLLQKESVFVLTRPKLKDELQKAFALMLTDREERIIKYRFGLIDGQCRTLEEVGQIFGITRERIRQLEAKALRKLRTIPETYEEHKYKSIFEKYNFDCDLFCELYNEDQIVYQYLKMKYKPGELEPSELLNDNSINDYQLGVLKKKYNMILHNGKRIIANRTEILLEVLRTFDEVIEYSKMIEEYNKIITENNLNIDLLTEEDFRNIDSILNRTDNVLCSAGRYYRYHLNELEDKDIDELQKMLDVEPGDYSSEFFFNNNTALMKKIDIRNEYELHNFLRKTIGNFNGKITYSRMPDILIECDDKLQFVENLIKELTPISLDEFTEYVYQNYGHKPNTLRALIVTYFAKYNNNGNLISECPSFSEEQMNILKEELTDDVYAISTIQEKLTALFNVDDFKLLNNMNLMKIGYKLRGNYILKSSINSFEAYMTNKISKLDYYTVEPELRKIGSTFSSYLYKLINSLDLFKIGDDKYITIKKLNEMGITKEDIIDFIFEIEKVMPENDYFNLYTLEVNNYLSKFEKYNFPDCFYESIISIIPNVKPLSAKNNMVFIKTKEQATREKFINSFINKEKIYLSEIQAQIKKKFNIELQIYYLREFIDKKTYYYDSSTDCIYKTKELYEQEINEFDILKYID